MTHEKLIDLFTDTYTVIKKESERNNNIMVSNNSEGIETIEFELEDNNITLNKGFDFLSITCNEDIVFNIPILEEPQKLIKVEEKWEKLLDKINDFNLGLKDSLNIKSYLTEKNSSQKLDNSIKIGKSKYKTS